MKANINQTCSSHMPVLIELVRVSKPKRVIEFGSGLFSTPLLAHCENFLSVESEEPWFNYLNRRYADRKWTLKLASNVTTSVAEITPCDLLFNDGDFREAITTKAFTCCPLIVCHDSQYNWAVEQKLPEGFQRVDFKRYPVMYPNHEQGVHDDRPWTTIFTSNDAVVKHFAKLEDWLYETYMFPYTNHIMDPFHE